MDRPILRPTSDRARIAWSVVLLAGIALCWILITPPGAAPDEPSHLTRSGALMQGELDGDPLGAGLDGHQLPDRYRLPDPACYAFQATVSVACADPPVVSGVPTLLATRADEYPIWGHLAYGLPTVVPGVDPIWAARLAGAAVAIAFVAGSLRLRPTCWQAAGVVVALTPMWWATVATVNPSSFGIAGAVGLWSALLCTRLDRPRAVAWLTALGWLALALPRRDGLIWASMIVVIGLAVTDRSALDWFRRLGLGPQAVIGASTLATVAWGATNDGRVSQMVAVSPLIVVTYDVVRTGWRHLATSRTRRAVLAGVLGVVGIAGLALVLRGRPGGWDPDLARAVADQTGPNLVEAIGVLGWLDTVLPELAVLVAVAAIGVLSAGALVDRVPALLTALAILATSIVTAWAFELFQGNTTGLYWQGRYSLPLLAGIPIALTATTVPVRVGRRLGGVALVMMLLVVNVAAWAASRRWGVGVDGSLRPWNWSTVHSPVEPLALLIAHAVCTAGLAVVLTPGEAARSRS